MGNRAAENDGIRDRSGSVDDEDPLVNFLYLLMRDHVSVGLVEGLVPEASDDKHRQYTNGHLARYAQDVAARLTGRQPIRWISAPDI